MAVETLRGRINEEVVRFLMRGIISSVQLLSKWFPPILTDAWVNARKYSDRFTSFTLRAEAPMLVSVPVCDRL